MTFLALTLATLALAATPDCLPLGRPLTGRVFTNADLDRLAACRQQAGTPPEKTPSAEPAAPAPLRRGRTPASQVSADRDAAEADWRARWRSVDQKARHLRREARELRQEAQQAPRDPKKKPTGRRAPSILLSRAESLETEARALEDEFHEQARREGALPGWLRPRAH